MKRLLLLFFATCFSLPAVSQAAAQETPPPPPNFVLIVREEIKPGEMPAHEREGAAFVQTLAKVNARVADPKLRSGRIAMSPVAGNENEVMYLWPYDSFDDMEKSQAEIDKMAGDPKLLKADFDQLPDERLHVSQRDMIASYRPDLSYKVGRLDVAQARYMTMQTVRVKSGHEDEYWEMMREKMFPARDKAGIKASYAVFQVIAGAPGTTFFVFRPFRSLAELDERAPVLTRNAMTEETRKEVDKVVDRAVMFQDVTFFRINPRLSHVAPEFAARDAASATPFWNPKPEAPAPAAGRRAVARNGRRP
jgi:hypothetical protein